MTLSAFPAPLKSPRELEGLDLRGTRTSYALLLAYTAMYFGRPGDFWSPLGDLHLPELLGTASAVTFVLALAQNKARLRSPIELKLIVYLTGWLTVGAFFSFWRANSLNELGSTWLKTFAIFFLLCQTTVSIKRIKLMIWTIVLSEFVVNGYSCILGKQGNTDLDGRYFGIAKGILWGNTLGIFVGMTLPFMAVLLLHKSTKLKSLLLACTFFTSAWVVIASASREGVTCMATSTVLIWVFVLRGRVLERIIGAFIFVIATVAVVLSPGVLHDRISVSFDADSATSRTQISAMDSTLSRMILLQNSLKYTFEHPLFGLGMGNFMVANGIDTQQAGGWLVTHNTYTELSSEGGIPAFVFFIGLIVVSLRQSWQIQSVRQFDREVRWFARALFVSILVFTIGCVFASLSYGLSFYYFIALGACLWAIRHSSADSLSSGNVVHTNA
jgi:O-antigen ligase